MIEKIHTRWIYGIMALFVAIQAVCLAMEFYYIALLPIILLIVWGVFVRLDWVVLFIVACVPVSLNLEQMELGGVGFYLPTEPLLFGVLVLFILKILSGKSIDTKIFTHPISWLIYAMLTWIFLTSITSELPLVSFKFLLARMWFIAGFYFLMVHIFQNRANMHRFLLLYLFPLFGVIVYTVIRHAGFGFDKEAGHWVMEPFYKDHTSYGAVLAMYYPVLIGLLLQKRFNALLKFFLLIGLVILTVGIIFSYTRAAWVSLAGACVLAILMLLRIKLRTIILTLLAVGSFLYMAKDDILIMLEKNQQDSSDDLAEHVESISNVSSDASNLERLNRWNSALAMFEERPLVGWGPGTYQFVYAPFQRSQDLTIISTNNSDGGNAHSEYLGPLSEQGIPGMLLMVLLVWMISRLSFRLFYTLKDRELRILVITCYLGLMTYFTHGILNNYLDTDKASAPFWGFIAILVAIDLFHREDGQQEKVLEESRTQ